MRQRVTYDTVLEQLAARIPHLAPAYESELASWAPETIPQTVFVESKFVPYLVQQLQMENELEVKRCFSFLEDLASSPDHDIRDLLAVAVAEPLIADAKVLKLALQAAGPRIRKIIVRIRDWPQQ
jgi:hypothetical protein